MLSATSDLVTTGATAGAGAAAGAGAGVTVFSEFGLATCSLEPAETAFLAGPVAFKPRLGLFPVSKLPTNEVATPPRTPPKTPLAPAVRSPLIAPRAALSAIDIEVTLLTAEDINEETVPAIEDTAAGAEETEEVPREISFETELARLPPRERAPDEDDELRPPEEPLPGLPLDPES